MDREGTETTTSPQARSRRDEYSDATRAALIASAARLFSSSGFARTSLDDIAADARVTKGALYHHFASKLALFEAVCDELEVEAVRRVSAAWWATSDPWDAALAALHAYLTLNAEPGHGRLVVQEGPVALGWERWHAQEERYGLGVTKRILERLVETGRIAEVPVESTARVIFGMLLAAAHLIVEAEDKEAAVEETQEVITRFLGGLRVPRG